MMPSQDVWKIIEAKTVDPPATWRPNDLPFWMNTSAADRRRAMDEALGDWLANIGMQDLRQLARQRRWSVKGPRKSEIIAQIVTQLVHPAVVHKAFASLDREHRQVLAAAVLLGETPGLQVQQVCQITKLWGHLAGHARIETYLSHLWDRGLTLPAHAVPSYYEHAGLVPDAIARSLPPVLADFIPPAFEQPAQPPGGDAARAPQIRPRMADPYELVRLANQLVRLLEQSPVPLRRPMPRPKLEGLFIGLQDWDYDPAELARIQKKGRAGFYGNATLTVPPPDYALPDEAIQELSAVLGDPARVEFLFRLLVAAGVFQPGSPVTPWPEVKERFMHQDEPAQRAILVRSFFYMANWSALWELLRSTEPGALKLKRYVMHYYYKPHKLAAELVAFRHQVLRALASLPDSQWVQMEDLFDVMRLVWPRFDQSTWLGPHYGAAPRTWFLETSAKKQDETAASQVPWALAQGAFTRLLIQGPLHWLGLADLSLEGDTVVAFRLHGLADLYWDRVDVAPAPRYAGSSAPVSTPASAVTLQQYTIQVDPSTVNIQVHTFLDRIARLENAAADRFLYRLDGQAVHEAFQSGLTLADLHSEWERLMPLAMPEQIGARLAAWWQDYGRIRLYQDLTVVEFADDFTLDELKAATSLSDFVVAEISPRLVIVPESAVAPLMAEMEKAGYMPKHEDGS